MEIICDACATKLSIPDDKLPKGVPSVTGKCPNCQGAILIRLDGSASPPPEAAAPAPAPNGVSEPAAAAPAPATPPPAAAEAPAPAPAAQSRPAFAEPSTLPIVAEDFVEGQRLALVSFNLPEAQATGKEALESLGYTVHLSSKPEEAIQRLRHSKYEVLLLDETYGGSKDANIVLGALQPMAMSMRRAICVGLVGKDFLTLDNMAAFTLSVNFVVAERELPKLKGIVRQAVADNDQFYAVFREAMREVGKA